MNWREWPEQAETRHLFATPDAILGVPCLACCVMTREAQIEQPLIPMRATAGRRT